MPRFERPGRRPFPGHRRFLLGHESDSTGCEAGAGARGQLGRRERVSSERLERPWHRMERVGLVPC